ncbi:threalose-6-phosphate phosphatase [Asimina triloba]
MRLDSASISELPDYMQLHLRAIVTAVENFEEELRREGKSYRISYFKNVYAELSKAYLKEARWASADFIPKVEEYMNNAEITSAYPTLTVASFVGMGDIATREAFEWAINKPNFIRAICAICRLKDDITSDQLEQERVHVASAVQCYMKEYGSTYEETCKIFREKAAHAWKDVNKEWLLEPLPVPREVMKRPLNLARVIESLYQYEDLYTNSSEKTKECITMLLVDPIAV